MLPKVAAETTAEDIEQAIVDAVLESESLDYKSDPAIRQPAEAVMSNWRNDGRQWNF